LLKHHNRQASASSHKKETPPILLVRITTGGDLFNIVGGSHAGQFGNDELFNQTEVDLVGAFLQDMHDYLDIWNEIEPSDRVQTAYDFTHRLQELGDLGFWVFGQRRRMKMGSVDGSTIDDWQVAIVQVVRSDSPTIIRIGKENELLAARPAGSMPNRPSD
jgi:hypothetical protein